MVKVVHLIVVGNESVDKHLEGVSILGAAEALLFDVVNGAEEGKADVLMKRLDEIGVYSEKREVDKKFGDIYWAALQEIQRRSFEHEDISLGINVSTGMSIAVEAVEYALKSPLYMDKLHAHILAEDVNEPDKFRYEVVEREGKIDVRTASLPTLNHTPFPKSSDEYLVYPQSRVMDRLRTFYHTLPVSWLFFKRSMRRRIRRLLRKLRLR